MTELTSKQRSYLMKLAATQTPLFQIGKSGLTPELVTAVGEALEARELIKINVLKNCEDEVADCAEKLSGRTKSEIVMTIGRRFVLYRRADEPKIQLPTK